MPELPEVETIRRQLAPLVEGRRMRKVEIMDPRWSRPLAPEELADAIRGRRVLSLGRRGKYLLWELEGDVHLAQHLRMTGAVLADPDPEPPHTRIRIELGPRAGAAKGSPGARPVRLAISDPRRFGTGELLLGGEALEEFLAARLGLEPFDEGFTAAHLRSVMRGRKAPVKALLLDQRRIAGVGNIYADEALFGARIHPRRAAGSLTLAQTTRLRETIIEALSAGIDSQGASIDDFRHVDGFRGSFQDRFMVHLREGEPCVNCGGTIVKMVVAGRGTYVCENCQPPPRLRRPGAPRGARPPRRAGSR
jgi:formamidopyrimidine-DNA glycosylase